MLGPVYMPQQILRAIEAKVFDVTQHVEMRTFRCAQTSKRLDGMHTQLVSRRIAVSGRLR